MGTLEYFGEVILNLKSTALKTGENFSPVFSVYIKA